MSAPDTRPETRAEPDLPECVHRVLVMADTGGKRNRSDHEAIRDAEKWCRARLAQPTQPDAVEARLGKLLAEAVSPAAWAALVYRLIRENDDIGDELASKLNEIHDILRATTDEEGG